MRKQNIMNRIFRGKGLLLAVVFLISVISVMIIYCVGASLRGAELHAVEQEIVVIEEENRKIADELVLQTSLTQVNENVENLNFVKPETLVYIENGSGLQAIGYAR